MSKRYEEFKKELITLCNKHKVSLSAIGYDEIAVWDNDEEEDPIDEHYISDQTAQDLLCSFLLI